MNPFEKNFCNHRFFAYILSKLVKKCAFFYIFGPVLFLKSLIRAFFSSLTAHYIKLLLCSGNQGLLKGD